MGKAENFKKAGLQLTLLSLDAVFCAPCFLFGSQDSTLVNIPLNDCKNALLIIKRHVATAEHQQNLGRADDFLSVAHGEVPDICSAISKTYKQRVERNRHILSVIIEVTILCGQQNIPIQGHVPERGNFMAFLWKAKDDRIFQSHLASCPGNAQYLSPQIQNEFINIIGRQIKKKILDDCKQSPFFALMADETTDITVVEQVALCI